MTVKKNTSDITGRVIQRYVILAALYTLLIFLLPANTTAMREHMLTPLQYKVLLFAIGLPSLMAWLAAFIGYARLHQYADSIADTSEGPSFKQLAKGSTWLAWSLPIPIILSLLFNAYANGHSDFRPTAIITSNYLNLLFPLTALTIIGFASRALTASAQLSFSVARARSIIAAFVVAGLAYCYFTFQRFDLSSFGSTDNPYYLPLWLMVITVIIPYLYVWFIGLLSAYEIALFSKNVKGVLYRQALRLLVFGLIAVVVSSIALQYINTVSPRVGYLVLDYKLLLILLFRILTGLGFVLIAVGANRLKKIEEV
ncbi:MAG: hypothetical protein JWO35_735 [Candidatus Saccharibacteria bacterium]|nr:hypothetical protein [Candidatus Saccharibacteria bacterium]